MGKKYMARARGIASMGPYDTEREAWKAVEGLDGLPVPEAQVWPVWPAEPEGPRKPG